MSRGVFLRTVCIFLLLCLLVSCHRATAPEPAPNESSVSEEQEETVLQLKDIGVNTLDAGFRAFPPMGGETQWKDGRSAKELARYFTASLPYVPAELAELLGQISQKQAVFDWLAEMETDFSAHGLGFGEGRNHDAALWNGEIFVGVEAKADEPFGNLYLNEEYEAASQNKKGRIEGLSEMVFGKKMPDGSAHLRYQLLTATGAVLLEAKERGLSKALFTVVEFHSEGNYSPEKAQQNENDLLSFLLEVGADYNPKGNYYVLPTPYGEAHGITLYFQKIIIDLPS